VLKFAVLGLLAEKPMSGFDLVTEFDVSRSVIWPAPQNEIYKILRDLARDGDIKVAERGARGRVVYAITAQGRTALGNWLADDSDYSIRYEPMLKAVFLRQANAAARRSIARSDLAFAESQLAKLHAADARRKAARGPDERADGRRLAILFYEAFAKWARETAGEK
jgi:DNA-binding PadR family transcriptional regulator